MNIIEAIKHPELFRPFLADRNNSLATWFNWMAVLRVLYGLPLKREKFLKQCTGRDACTFPANGFETALYLCGRRSGKSRIAAVIGAFEATMAGHENKLAPGESGLVAICAPSKNQGRVIKNYIRAIFNVPALKQLVKSETQWAFDLTNGIRIEILAGDFRLVRGYTCCAVIADEVAFMGVDEDSRVRSDMELVRAIQPALATTGGKLIAITTPYAPRGWVYKTYQRHHGKPGGTILVVNSPSRGLNPTLKQSVIDQAMAEDLQSAKSEFMAEFRDDVSEYLPRHVIEGVVIKDRMELLPRSEIKYRAFVDVSGGRVDAAALAIGHMEQSKVVIDCLRHYKPPFNPEHVCAEVAAELGRFNLNRVMGDNFAAEFTAAAFERCGIRYTKCDKVKSTLYLELLPRICSGEVELLDNEVLVEQLSGLERRVRSGGKDVVEHKSKKHDDLANVVAGIAHTAAIPRRRVGCF